MNHSYDNHVRDDDDELSNEAEEKQFEEELDDLDTIQQLQNEMNIPGGTAEMNQQTSVRSGRFLFLSKLPLVPLCENILF
jgi:hypothetical protein